METTHKTFFRILFFVAILTCYGLNSYSNETINPFSVEFSEGTNTEITIISDIDLLNDDQIPQLNFDYSYPEPKCLVPVSKDFLLIPNSAFSIWQPPQL
jgi:hypothetical protein